MMSFKSTLAAVASAVLLSSVAASPVANLTRRGTGVEICTKTNWGGSCFHGFPPWNTCQEFAQFELGYLPQLGGNVALGSFGPDQGVTCLWYTEQGCNGVQSGAVNYPGYGDLPGPWAFETASFKCWW